jgi:hypothetical protein
MLILLELTCMPDKSADLKLQTDAHKYRGFASAVTFYLESIPPKRVEHLDVPATYGTEV